MHSVEKINVTLGSLGFASRSGTPSTDSKQAMLISNVSCMFISHCNYIVINQMHLIYLRDASYL